MKYRITYTVEPYSSLAFSGHWCIMGRAYDGTGKLCIEDSLTGPFKKADLEAWIVTVGFCLDDRTLVSGQTWRKRRLP